MNLDQLRKKILEFNNAYEKGEPIVEDFVYDFYKKKLAIIEANENIKISNEIGTKPNYEEKCDHLFPILSLDHDFGKAQIEKFVKKIEKKTPAFPFIAEPKIDGVSIIARYEKHKLVALKTRGNGFAGQNITHLAPYLPLPDHIFLPQTLEIRFEAYLEKNILKNPRNATAGMLLKKEIDPNLKFIKLAPHNLYSATKIWETYEQLQSIFEKMHLNKIQPCAQCNSLEEMQNFFEQLDNIRETLPFEIDGVVFKINDYEKQQLLGNTATAPRSAFAIKFNNPSAISIIKDIKFQVGRFGKITPVAIIEETIINDRKITKATLNNLNDLKTKQYSKNDIVKIEMAGEVIPMITDIIEKIGKETSIPTHCPACNNLLEEETCKASWQCKGQQIERIKHFVSKHCLNIEGLGTKQITFFNEAKILQYPCDLYEIKNRINTIQNSATWLGEKALQNIIEAIEKSKYTNMISWYTSLGMPNIGKTKAISLSQHFNNFEDFLKTTEAELTFLGPEIAKDVYNYKEEEKEWINKTWKYMKIGEEYQTDSITLF